MFAVLSIECRNLIYLKFGYTLISITGYGAHAGPSNGQGTKGNGTVGVSVFGDYKSGMDKSE